jgi:hypothetical protein
MKRSTLVLLGSVSLGLVALAGCGKKSDSGDPAAASATATTTTSPVATTVATTTATATVTTPIHIGVAGAGGAPGVIKIGGAAGTAPAIATTPATPPGGRPPGPAIKVPGKT